MFKSLKKIKRFLVITAVLVAMLCNIPSEAAAFYSYIYDIESKSVAAPDAALPVTNITGATVGTTAFNVPQDLFIFEDEMYIADTGNHRIVITDMKFTKSRVISSFMNKGKKDTFNEPQGVCVTKEAIFVADTKNKRIVKLSHKGKLMLIMENPEHETFDKDFVFKPSKISVDSFNRIFVVSAGYNLGLMQFNPDGTYFQSIGAPKVTVSVFEQIKRKFMTDAQLDQSAEVVPTEYSNIHITEDGFIFVTSESTDKEVDALRQLNAKGADIITRIGDPSGDIIVGKGSVSYTGESAIVDVAEVGEYGNLAILDRKRSRVFVYNDNCQLLYVFAGPGSYNGALNVPSAMVCEGDKFYIADRGRNAIAIFELTEYGKMFNEISKAKKDIDYEREEELWGEILAQNANCTLALNGLGNAAYKKQDYEKAMEYFKLAENRTDYSKAYGFVRRAWLENNIIWGVIVVAIAAVLFFLYGKFKKKYVENAPKDSFLGRMYFSSYVCFHPFNGYWVLKREKRGSYGLATLWLVGAIAAMVISNLFNGFIFNTNNLQTYNMMSNVLFVTAAVVVWTVAQWCVTSLMSGEGKLGEVYIATCYALRPYVICNLIATLLSQVLLETEGDFYYVLVGLALFWVGILLFSSVMQTHDYSFGKTLLVILIILVVIILIIFIGMLVMALMQQLIAFIKDIITEVTLRV